MKKTFVVNEKLKRLDTRYRDAYFITQTARRERLSLVR